MHGPQWGDQKSSKRICDSAPRAARPNDVTASASAAAANRAIRSLLGSGGLHTAVTTRVAARASHSGGGFANLSAEVDQHLADRASVAGEFRCEVGRAREANHWVR